MTERKTKLIKSKRPVRAPARPRDETIKEAICIRLAEGESLRGICSGADMPDKSTVFRWLVADQQFQAAYSLACRIRAEEMGFETLEISDDARNDWMEQLDEDGKSEGWKLNGEHVHRSKLRVDTRKWLAAKLWPKKYGDATLLKHGDPDGLPMRKLSETEIAIRLASILQVHLGKEEK